MCARLSPALGESKILARQACYRPITEDGLPLIGPVPGVKGAYVATGHSVWGILNAPATGEAMAELIVDGVARTVDLSRFGSTPRRCSCTAVIASIASGKLEAPSCSMRSSRQGHLALRQSKTSRSAD